MNSDVEISIVIPVYKGEAFLVELFERIKAEMTKGSLSYEVLFVDDASPDGSSGVIRELCGNNRECKGLILSRNFGQQGAITAGLRNARGKWIAIMDCDLQDRPEEILRMYEEARKGYDLVWAGRANRQDSLLKRLGSRMFYIVFNLFSDIPLDPDVANFGLYNKKVIEAILSGRPNPLFSADGEMGRFSKHKTIRAA